MRFRLSRLSVLVVGLFASGAVGQGDPDFGIDFVTVSDPGNLAYPGKFDILLAGRGSVNYTFRVSRTEITTGQWIQFVNLFSTQSDELDALLRPGPWAARIDVNYNGPGGHYIFTPVVDYPELSPVGITWRQAAMFCNWMHNGCSDDPQTLFNGVYDTSTFSRNDDNTYNDQDAHFPSARYWIVTLDEYLKAVYYDPNKNEQGPGWWEFGHGSDEPPIYGVPGVGDVGRELTDDELEDLNGSTNSAWLPLGIYPDAKSPWGLLDVLGGNFDFVEDWEPTVYRRARASKLANNGIIDDNEPFDRIWMLNTISPRSPVGGFRIASLPRPAADLNEDWHVNFFDVSQFIELFYASDTSVDFDDDGVVDAEDVMAFLGLYLEGA